jgi:monoamine oxidase
MAMPPVSLNRIVFTPKLPQWREMINQKNFMGSTIKVVLLYEKDFWREQNYSG